MTEAVKPTFEVLEVNLYIKENGKNHQTMLYSTMRKENPHLVVRRGKLFKLQLKLNRPYKQDDSIQFIFSHKASKYPSLGNKTKVLIALENNQTEDSTKFWNALLDKNDGEYLTVFITPPVSAIIGEWSMEIDCIAGEKISSTYVLNTSIILILNAWCKDDAVYMEDDEKKTEYVLRDSGFYWGVHKNRKIGWNYGQYDENILECSLLILQEVSGLPLIVCNDTVMISRAISASMTKVILGNWSGNYEGGTNPSQWASSTSILSKYYNTKQRVKFAQCWVFAALTVTVCRALGMPARFVTCFDSAHDHELSFTIDSYVNELNMNVFELSRDSIWNFHAWNEVWTRRPDLDSKYDGWQAIDATPQEESDKIYRLGPSPLLAIKNGEVYVPYDTAFVCAEVNSDELVWKYRGVRQPLKLLSSSPTRVGSLICTLALDGQSREDLTDNYKYPEKSKEEREIFMKMLKASGSVPSRYYLNEQFNDIRFDFKLIDSVFIGKPFGINLTAKNVSNQEYKVTALLTSSCRDYTGKEIKFISTDNKTFTVPAGDKKSVIAEVQYADYVIAYKVNAAIHISALCSFEGNDIEYYAEDDFTLDLPEINVEVENSIQINTMLYGKAYFQNPLPEVLTNCVFVITGLGIDKRLKYKIDDVSPSGEAKVNFKMVPKLPGIQMIIAKFSSDQLNNVDGYLETNVAETDVVGTDDDVVGTDVVETAVADTD